LNFFDHSEHSKSNQHPLKGFNTCAFKKKHMLPFLGNILEPIINLRIFDESLNNKKHFQILQSLKGPCQQVLCV